MFTKILVLLDGSPTAESVLPYAGHWAKLLEVPVELLTVVDVRGMLTSTEKARNFDKLFENEIRAGEKYLNKTASSFGGARVHCSVEKGLAEETIVAQAEANPGALVAMATHGRSGVDRWLLGSVAEKVLRGAKAPLLLVRVKPGHKTAEATALTSIVVPLDGSALAESVLPMVGALANRLKLAVILFRACQMPSPFYGGGHDFHSVKVFEDLAELKGLAGEYLERQAAAIKNAGVEKLSTVTREGFSADEIIKIAQETPNSLIAMCSHGRSGVNRWLLGSVTETVARHASCPVLVLRPS